MKGPPPKPEPPAPDESYQIEQYRKDMVSVTELVETAQRQSFFGELVLRFNGGNLQQVDTKRTIIPAHRSRKKEDSSQR